MRMLINTLGLYVSKTLGTNSRVMLLPRTHTHKHASKHTKNEATERDTERERMQGASPWTEKQLQLYS